MLKDAEFEMLGSTQFAQQLISVRKELRAVCNRWAIELATTAQYAHPLEVLSHRLVELPGDAALRASQHNIHTVAAGRGQAGS